MRAIALLVFAVAAPALAMDKPPSQQRAVPGAGWSAVSISGNSGKDLFQRYCAECHGAGPFKPGTAALQAKYRGSEPALLEQRIDLPAAFVIYTVRHGVSVMPAERKTEIGDAELKAIADYLARNTK